MTENEITYLIRKSIYEVYNYLGPGLLENIYEKAMLIELQNQGLEARNQVPISVDYKEIDLEMGFRADILVEECDGFDVKIAARLKAREKGIPVIMDTNDIGMLDVERFDLERERPIFHGKVEELDSFSPEQSFAHLKKLSFQEKFGYLIRIIGFENTSEEMKFSLSQLNKTINGWPQLASAVTLGAAIVTDACRRILLGKFTNSGRFFVHFNELIK